MMYQQWISAGMKPNKQRAMLIQKSAEQTPRLMATGKKGRKIPIKASNQSRACIIVKRTWERKKDGRAQLQLSSYTSAKRKRE